jgi:hypothetical protein
MKSTIPCLTILGCLSVPLTGFAQGKTKSGSKSTLSKAVTRGEYLVQFGGCNDCHTPWSFNKQLNMPLPDLSRRLSGHPEGAPDPGGSIGPQDISLIGPTFTSFKMPFGIVYSPNLTPDMDTGMGSWKEADFIKAMRNGKHFGGNGRAILPPMPWMSLAVLTDDDLKAVFAYLQALPPIRNAVPEHKVLLPVIDGITESFEKLKASMRTKGQP